MDELLGLGGLVFLRCGLFFKQSAGACPLGGVGPGWIWTGVQWCTLEVCRLPWLISACCSC